MTMAICTGCLFCLAAVAERGGFQGWRTDQGQDLADFQRGTAYLPGGVERHSPANGRRLDDHYAPIYNETYMWLTPYGIMNVSQIDCPVEANGSSAFPALSFEDQRAEAVTFMIVVTLYMFLGLAIVCDSFFEASLSAICEAMNLKDDVAGATWMAAGGSAPELATSIIGLFVSSSDIGFGTIVGSAVFNVLFVIGCCAFVAPNLKLTWWPLARDASYYCFSLAMIVIFVSDLKVEWYESLILLVMYVGYVTVMYFNERLEVWVTSRVRANEEQASPLQQTLKKVFDHPVRVHLLVT
jgi:hypothetical protein